MALITEQRKRQQRLIVTLVAVFAVTLGVMYFGFLREEPERREASLSTSSIEETLGGIRDIDLDLSILKDKKFQVLESYEVLPRKIETGRSNPFLQ